MSTSAAIDERLTEHFWLAELIESDAATRWELPNWPHALAMANLRHILAPGLQSVRDILRVPLIVSSGYRSPQLNHRVGGSPASQHMDGLAADVRAPAHGSPLTLARTILRHRAEVGYDQLILEHGSWVHISFPPAGRRPRDMVLTITRQGVAQGLPEHRA